MATVNVEFVKFKGQDKLNKKLKELSVIRASLKIGFFQNSTYPDGTPVAAVAYINEYGANNHPARPFMQKTATANMNKWVDGIAKNIKGAGKFNLNTVKTAYKMAGIVAVGDVKKTIKSWPPGGNSKQTVARKAKRAQAGKGTSAINPETVLIDTGKMISSVAYEVRG